MGFENGKGEANNWLVSGGRGWWFLKDAAAAATAAVAVAAATAAEMVHAML